METICDILNNFSNFFNMNNIPFVIGGGYGVKLYSDMFSLPVSFDVNNLDIFYLANTPITASKIHHYNRISEPRTTTTYISDYGFHINITMMRNNAVKFIHYDDIKIMHPKTIISFYSDDFEMDEIKRFKYIILDSIIQNIDLGDVYYITKQNTIQNETHINNEFNTMPIPLSRRLFAITE